MFTRAALESPASRSFSAAVAGSVAGTGAGALGTRSRQYVHDEIDGMLVDREGVVGGPSFPDVAYVILLLLVPEVMYAE